MPKQIIEYNKGQTITVMGKRFSSFAAACKYFNLPRQQTLRAFRKALLSTQFEVDNFFEFQRLLRKNIAGQYLENMKSKFKDKRATPIRYHGAIFRSRTALSIFLETNPNHFKCRMSFLENAGVNLSDDIIKACTSPLHKSTLSADIKINKLWSSLAIRHGINISLTRLERLVNDKDSALDVSTKQMALLFNVKYETLKRHIYDTRLPGDSLARSAVNSLCCIKPTGTPLNFDGKLYQNVFSFMTTHNCKLDKQNTLRLLNISSAYTT